MLSARTFDAISGGEYNFDPPMGHLFRRRGETARRRWRAIVRVVAFVLLLITAVDLASSQFCGEETAPLSREPLSVAMIETDGHSLPPASTRDGCFCCCSHVVHVSVAVPASSPAILGGIPSAAAPQVPFATPRPPFHPPRAA